MTQPGRIGNCGGGGRRRCQFNPQLGQSDRVQTLNQKLSNHFSYAGGIAT